MRPRPPPRPPAGGPPPSSPKCRPTIPPPRPLACRWPAPLVTQVQAYDPANYYAAEAYHQNYYAQNPNQVGLAPFPRAVRTPFFPPPAHCIAQNPNQVGPVCFPPQERLFAPPPSA